MKGRLSLLLLCCIFISVQSFSQSKRPKLGVTLSGGGAKGLAHIGILKAIDSAGLHVDYITGTSMGSIVGALYAAGYSGKDLEKIAKTLNWDILLSNTTSLRSLVMEEKEEFEKYAVELPWLNHRFVLPTGIIESEELWLKFSELFFPVYNIKDFSKFSIPFKCIAADISNGDAVILDSGEIVTAIRSSMAIPSVFTSVDDENRKLVDGGIVRNFPVKDVREMGAEIVIGSNVSTGLLPTDKVKNAVQVLLQIAFFKSAEDSKKEIQLCDIYVPFQFENLNMASFNRADEILELGLARGRELYPRFKRLADSLNAIYGEREGEAVNRLPIVDSIKIKKLSITGLENTSEDFFRHMMNFYEDKFYTARDIAAMVRRVFGTRYYKRILYKLEPQPDSTVNIVFSVAENPRSFAKLGLHYNKFTGIGLIGNFTIRNFFSPHSRSMVTLNLGQVSRIKGEHMQYLGRSKNIAAIAGIQYEYLDIPRFTNYEKDGEYRQNYFLSELRFQYSTNRNFTIGIGSRYEWIRYKPSIVTNFEIKGKNEFLTSFLFWGINTLDRPALPRKGVKMEGELGWVYNQSPSVKTYVNGTEVNGDSLGIRYNNYERFSLNVESYSPIGKRVTFISQFQAGINFNYDQNIFNDFVIGGMNNMFRNQVLFAGLEEGSFFTPSVAVAAIGLRVNVINSLYAGAKTNFLVNNFISPDNSRLQRPSFLSGHALTLGYNFALGPLEISAMYSDQSRRMVSYINIGIPF